MIIISTAALADEHHQLSSHALNKIAPYLLPYDHPVKARLDRIFSQARVILSVKSMQKAGFICPKPRKFTHLIVTKHPALPGYIIKAYLDAQRYYKNKPEYDHWIKRIQGAHAIRQYIQEKHLEPLFKVPRKWIYLLPVEPEILEGFLKKYTILVEEDMDILDKVENNLRWESDIVNETLLDILYALLSELGLRDCAKPDNIPFAEDGRICFIDTETYNASHVLYEKLTPFLSKPMRRYWEKLIKGW